MGTLSNLSKPTNFEVTLLVSLETEWIMGSEGSSVGFSCINQNNVERNLITPPASAGLRKSSPYFDRW
jgi:hypothetical protein